MKELEIIIKQDFGMWRMSIKCEANLANTGIIKMLFGCLQTDGVVIRSGISTNIMKLLSVQAELLSFSL